MDSKLTLKLDKQIIEKAQKHAASQNRSLSRIIESYLRSVTNQDTADSVREIEISPFVKSISSDLGMPADFDYKSEYAEHLSEKYK